ncbi:hypothetical protein LZ554_007366 [Drepanopeziza brunnea f. sp. 'monogermtubi']|nr:hypothetical protein LZ554_007366 [Drepanopeziza brunnea f. sp. 'monogermtubi']
MDHTTHPLKPTHYALHIEPHFQSATFDGSSTISISIHSPTTCLTLNAHQLTIKSSTLSHQESSHGHSQPVEIKIAHTSADPTRHTFTLFLAELLPAGARVFLHQTFSGLLRRDGMGFHITDVGGGGRRGGIDDSPPPSSSSSSPMDMMMMASTLFEPRGARTVFPCFDEPCYKTTFCLTLVVAEHLTCLSNTPVRFEGKTTTTTACDDESQRRKKKQVEFHRTPLIPTYLLAFAVGDFHMVEKKTDRPSSSSPSSSFRIPIRAYAPRRNDYDVEKCRFALDVAAQVLAVFEQTFQLECGLAKLDLLAVPGSVGAMENWGLVTISTAAVFIGGDSSAAERLACAQLVTHELAHQWSGNLVGVPSWEHFWLKEALADWAEVTAHDAVVSLSLSPSDSDSGSVVAWRDFAAERMQKALLFDSSRFTHPLEIPIALEEGPYLDEVTYGKGCAVIRMLSELVGQDLFLQGLRRYFRENAYGTAHPDDLWRILTELSGSDIGALMKPWAQVPGHPVVTIEENEAQGTITARQSPFVHSGAVEARSYPVSLGIVTGDGTLITEVLDQKSKSIKVSLDFYKVNTTSLLNFYRVAHPVSRIRRLGGEVGRGALSVEDRISLVADTSALALAGHPDIRTSDLLGLVRDLQDEQCYFVWKPMIATLREISRRLLFEDETTRDAFAKFHRDVVKTCLDRKGRRFDASDDMDEQRFKAMMIGNSAGDETTVAAAESMFARFIDGDEAGLNRNIRSEVFEIVLRRGGKREYKQLCKKLESSTGSTRKDILRSLGYSQDTACIKKTIRLATAPSVMADVGLRPALEALATHRKGVYSLWRFIASGAWSSIPGLDLEKVAPVGEMVLNSLTETAYSAGARRYLESQDSKTLGAEAERCFEGIEARARWLERDREDLIGFLRRNGYYKHAPNVVQRSLGSFRSKLEMLSCL